MKQSEIYTEAKDVLNNVFSSLLKSEDKATWKKALDFSSVKIQDCNLRANKAIMQNNEEEGTKYLQKKEIWNKVHFLLLKAYGTKFIRK